MKNFQEKDKAIHDQQMTKSRYRLRYAQLQSWMRTYIYQMADNNQQSKLGSRRVIILIRELWFSF